MQPLLLTRDQALVDEVARLSAAAGVRPDVYDDPLAALSAWPGAPLVLVGADLVEEVAAARPGRRDGVHVLGWAPADAAFRAALAIGAGTVGELPLCEGWLVDLLADSEEAPGRGRTIGVIGGAGGAGASTFACAVGQVASARGPTLLVDTDPLGPGLDRLLGLESVAGVRWGDLASSSGRLGARSLREAVPRSAGGLGALTWSPGTVLEPDAAVVREAVAAAQRGHDLVVLDLARHGTALVDELVARCDRLLVVVPATLAGVSASVRLLDRLGAVSGAALAVRRGGVSWEDVERATGLPVAVEVPEQRGLLEAVDLGLGPVRHPRVPLARAARQVLGEAA
jgi:secretion/DNA translocation related CpaE-like protein